MSMNKDLVAQAVAAIPLWIAFLDQKDAQQDALIEQMQNPKKNTLRQKATSLLKKKEDDQQVPSETTSSPIDLDGGKPSANDPDAKEDIRWAPTEEAAKEAEEAVEPGSDKEENQFKNMF